ncbi:protein O-glucosyltransferase 2-like isoform X1 [Neodiprion virginianus]|uniref:protein O-glucosyltransferase 2-like isoform X1 n=2 Tax=Neodiprion virginianus TaxID=2961670 RepID=UPI001EE76287|nr:protein O-glucosyltransferase 2-like isoform X1 [Neodiprion virginianus]
MRFFELYVEFAMKLFHLIFYCLCQYAIYARNNVIDEIIPSKTLVWGPGLYPDKIVMRARYIFLQLRDQNEKNSSISAGEEVISAQIQGETLTGSPCHIWKQILDRKDGSFIVRYKLYQTCMNLQIVIRVKNEDVPASPLIFAGPVYEEECYCPNEDINDWLEKNQCPLNYSQIQADLQPFFSLDFDAIRKDIIKKFDRPYSVSICHYVVKLNKIYRQCYGQHVGFKTFMDAILLSLARKFVIPDIELFVNLGDWPLVSNTEKTYPIFSWCGSDDSKDIAMPSYDLTESTLENMGRVMLDMLSVQGNTKLPWLAKVEKAFWRGRDSCRERLDLIDIARKHPDLINASITNFFFFKNEIDKYGPRENHTSFFNFFDYKYQLNIDGSVAAYRFPYLLAGDSLVFKQESKYYEFFYKQLRPYEHYIPIKKDLTDLVEKIRWAKQHDNIAYKVSRNGQLFARDNLMPQNIFCYHAVLFKEWSNRLKSKVVRLAGMEEVPQPESSCKCHRINAMGSKEEL